MHREPTVVLVDDDQSVRDALKWLIESVELRVDTYSSAADFLQSFDPRTPGCLVLDVRMPGMSGLELQENLAAHKCGLPVIIITGHADVAMCVRAFEGGAFAFLEKPVIQQDLLEQIQKAVEKDRKSRQESIPATDIDDRVSRLTPREREVMDLLVVGQSMKQIANRLQVSLPTCSKHRANVLDKLDVDNDVQLVRRVHSWKTPSL
ncbi:MAG: response regulator [Pirellulaceae bacterium]|jgi:FixJ family two-component response regulator|nr:response regulator [Pirellulaceae bacterium]